MNSNGRVAELDMDMGPGLGVPLYSLLTFFKGPRSPRGVQGQQSERSSRRAVYA